MPSSNPIAPAPASAMRGRTILVALAASLACTAAAADGVWTLTPLGDFNPVDIDDAGRIVGYAGPDRVPSVRAAGVVTALPIASGSQSYANAVNGQGLIAGYMHLASGRDKAVTWSDGVRTRLRTLGGDSARAWGIASDGRVVGESQRSDGSWRPVSWVAGVPTRLKVLADTDQSVPYGANIAGTSVGMSHFPARGTFGAQATAWVEGRPRQLSTLGGESVATGINDAGQIIGFGYLPSNINARALVWSGPAATPVQLDHLAGDSSFAEDINAAGIVVGRSFAVDSQIGQHGVMWVGSAITDLNAYLAPDLAAAGWVVVDAPGINDAGAIVGRMCLQLPPFTCQGFLLAPAGN